MYLYNYYYNHHLARRSHIRSALRALTRFGVATKIAQNNSSVGRTWPGQIRPHVRPAGIHARPWPNTAPFRPI